MTQTDVRTYYTDYYYSDTSSVIEQVWYDAETQDMYVLLLNGTMCGYENVRPEVYRAFVGQEAAGNSIGAYWNAYIKRGLTGKSTDGVKDGLFLRRGEEEDVTTATIFQGDTVQPVYTVEDDLVAQAPVAEDNGWEGSVQQQALLPEVVRNEYLLAFEHDGGTGEIILYASSIEEALANFDIVRGAARYVNVVINSVTLFFNN